MTAGLVEVGLIWYMGRVVDLLSTGTPAEVLSVHGLELILAAVFILTLRPLIQGLDVALLNNGILLRPLGNVIYLMLPLVTPEAVLRQTVALLHHAINTVRGEILQ